MLFLSKYEINFQLVRVILVCQLMSPVFSEKIPYLDRLRSFDVDEDVDLDNKSIDDQLVHEMHLGRLFPNLDSLDFVSVFNKIS